MLLVTAPRCWPVSVEASKSLNPGVSIEPGLMAFTRIRRCFRSVVHVLANDAGRPWSRCKHCSTTAFAGDD